MPTSKLLIVEDEAIVAEDLAHKVRALGYEVIGIASSGEEAAARAREAAADLVLLDIHLDGHLDGVELAKTLKDVCDPAIVFVTAHSDLQTVKEAEAISPVGFVLKPFGERDLAVQLEIALHKHRSNKALLKNQEELRRANAQLLKTQEVLLAAQRGAKAGIWEMDLRTGAITWSQPYYELFGIDPALPPSPALWISHIHPDDRTRISAEHERSIKEKRYQNMEFRIVRPDGSIRWIQRQGNIEIDEQGQAIRINGISFDITDRKQAEDAVAAVALFPAQNPSPVLRVDADGILLYKNPASHELLKDLNLKVGQPVPTYLRDLVDNALRTARAEKSEQSNGDHHYLITVTPIDERYANLYWMDITERKETEQALREREAQLALELTDATLLQAMSAALLAEEDAEGFYEKLLDAALAIMRSDFASMQVFDPERGKLRLLAFRGFTPEAANHWEWIQLDSTTSCGLAYRTASRTIVTDVECCDFIAGTDDLRVFRNTGIRAMQSTPLITRRGRLVGMISTHWNRPHTPDAGELRKFDILARQAADILEHREAERSIRDSEQRFRAFTSGTNAVVYRMSPDWTEMRYLQGREFITDTLEPSRTWLNKYIHPDDQPDVTSAIQRAIQSKSVFELEHRIIRADGSLGWISSRAIPILDHTGAIIEWFGAASDVTQRKQAEAWLAGQGEALEAALNDAPLDSSLGVLVRTATDRLGPEVRAAFYLAGPEGVTLSHVVGMPAAYAEAVDGFKIGPGSLACGLATHTGQPVVTSDVTKEPLWAPWLWLAEKFDYRGCWSFPIHTTAGKYVGSFALYWRKPREANQRDIEFAALVTQTAGMIIARHCDMEVRRRAEEALQQSEERFRSSTAPSDNLSLQFEM